MPPTIARDDRYALEQALSRLPARSREIIVMLRVEQKSYAEMAASLCVDEGTIERRVAEAIQQLADVMYSGRVSPREKLGSNESATVANTDLDAGLKPLLKLV
jgi:DNA-directed RNA polymerase specialized sigma24 family protein